MGDRYEARVVDGGMPAECCPYGVVDWSTGCEVCRVWEEVMARRIAALLNADPHFSGVPRAAAAEQELALRDVRRMAREADTSPQTADRWAERIEERINEVLGGDDD